MLNVIVFHLNQRVACAKGLASDTEHKAPYIDAAIGHNDKFLPAVWQLWNAHCYEPAAVFNFTEHEPVDRLLDECFGKTQHIDAAWTLASRSAQRQYIAPFALHRTDHRSTSVGDIMETYNQDTGETRRYVVAPVGFVHLNNFLDAQGSK